MRQTLFVTACLISVLQNAAYGQSISGAGIASQYRDIAGEFSRAIGRLLSESRKEEAKGCFVYLGMAQMGARIADSADQPENIVRRQYTFKRLDEILQTLRKQLPMCQTEGA